MKLGGVVEILSGLWSVRKIVVELPQGTVEATTADIADDDARVVAAALRVCFPEAEFETIRTLGE